MIKADTVRPGCCWQHDYGPYCWIFLRCFAVGVLASMLFSLWGCVLVVKKYQAPATAQNHHGDKK